MRDSGGFYYYSNSVIYICFWVYAIDIYVKISSFLYAFYKFYIFTGDFVVILLSRCDNVIMTSTKE